jgi:putative flippase GtrA
MKHIVRELQGAPSDAAKRQIIRYGIVVGSGYALAIAAYSGELSIGIPPYAGLGVAFALNALFNFALIRLWAFPPTGRTLGSDLMRFSVVAAASFLVNYSSFALLYSIIGFAAATSQRLGIIIAAPVTFLANRIWSFRAHPPAGGQESGDPSSSPTNTSYSRM